MQLLLNVVSRHAAWVVTLLCAGIIVCFPLFDYDLYWHLANGREMVSQTHIINEEIFSYTRFGIPFSNHEWLAQTILFLVYQQWGGIGLNILKLVLALVAVALLFRTCRIVGATPGLAGFLCVAAVLVGMFRYNVRPELFSLLGVTVLSYLLYGFRSRQLSARALYTLPVVVLAWDWLHGAVFGVIIFVAYVSGENAKFILARRLSGWSVRNPLSGDLLTTLNIVMALTVVASLLNPYGLRSYGIFFEFLGNNPLIAITEEFEPPDWANYPAFWMMLWSLGALFVFRWRKIDLTSIFLFLPFAYLAVHYSRATGECALVCAPIAAQLLTASAVVNEAKDDRNRLKKRAVVFVAIVVTVAFITYVKFFQTSSTHRFGLGVDDAFLPVGSVRFVKAIGLNGNLYNSGNFGGYLSFFITPQRKIFQYNHHTVFGDTLRFLQNPAELDHWNINYAIVGLPAELDVLFPRSQWARIYRERSAVVVIRRTEENRGLIARHEWWYFHPARSYEDLKRIARHPGVFARLIEEIAMYLTYREDRSVADLFVDLLESAPSQISISQQHDLVSKTIRANQGNARLENFLSRTIE